MGGEALRNAESGFDGGKRGAIADNGVSIKTVDHKKTGLHYLNSTSSRRNIS